MIQFNLLPDVKQELVRVKRTTRLVMSFSIIVSAVAIVIFVLLFAYNSIQKHHINDLNKTYATSKDKLQSTPNLNGILTIQNQLSSLPQLDASKPVVSRVFGFLSQITPSTVTINSLNMNFTGDQLTISGQASTLADLNIYADTLKFTTYKPSTDAFTNVVESSFSVDSSTGVTTYTFTLNFSPDLFNVSDNVGQLNVPNEITTRSVQDQPKIFGSNTPGGS